MAADRAYLEAIAAQYHKTLEQLLAEELFRGDKEWAYSGLVPQTEYCFYIYGLDVQGEPTTAVNYICFSTPAVGPVECSFTLQASEVTTDSFLLTVTPSDAECPYYYDVFTQEMWMSLCGGDARNIPAFMEDYVKEMAAENKLTISETVARLSSYGEQTERFDYLNSDASYWAFAVGVGVDGTATTPAVVRQVTTLKPPANTFEVERLSVGFDKASFLVLPSQREAFVALCELQEYFEGMSDGEMIDEVIRAYGAELETHLFSGESKVTEEMLVPDKPYYLLVFGYAGGQVTTPLTKYAFTTEKARSVDCTFEISVRNVKKTTADVRITPSDDKASFFFNFIRASEYASLGGDQAAIHAFSNGIIDDLVAQTTMPRYEWLSRALERGPISWALDGLTAGTEYHIFAVGMVSDGSFTTPVFMSEPFTTEAEGVCSARLEFLPNILSGGSSHPDEALVYGWFYPTDAAYTLVCHHVNDDSVYTMQDADALAYLNEHGERFTDTSFYVWDYVPYGQTAYYVAAAYDEKGLSTICRATATPPAPVASSLVRPYECYRGFKVEQAGLSGLPQPRASKVKRVAGLRKTDCARPSGPYATTPIR